MNSDSFRGGWRVKLYELENSGNWVDHGIGFSYIQLSSSLEGPVLAVISEKNSEEFLLQSKIHSEDFYEKQGETMIIWKEAGISGNIDYALSFQEAEGCSFIWNCINEVQGEYLQQREYGNVPSFARTQRVVSSENSSASLHRGGSDSNSASAFTVLDDHQHINQYSILPTDFQPQESFLSQVKAKLESLHASQRDYVSAQLLHEDCLYIKHLLQLFQQFEAKQRQKELTLMAEIFRSILLLNDPSIIEYLLSHDDTFRDISGIFEYDKTLREKGQYRHFLFQVSQQKQIIDLSEEVNLASKFLYRLKYVRDIMLHPTIDDPGVSAINSMITFTSGEICSKIMSEEAYLTELFSVIFPNVYQSLLRSPDGDRSERDRQKYFRLLYQQQLERLQPFLSRKGSQAGQKSPAASLPSAFHGVLFLKELITLSKFMSFDRRVEHFKTFFANYKEIFVPVILFLFQGATRALHYQISPKPPQPRTRPSSSDLQVSASELRDRRNVADDSGNPLIRQTSPASLLKQSSVSSSITSKSSTERLATLSSASPTMAGNDDSFEQETVKDNITDRVESCSQQSLSEEMEVGNSFESDKEARASEADEVTDIPWIAYEELFSHSQSLEVINHLADILSTIAFTFPSLLREVVLEGSHPPVLGGGGGNSSQLQTPLEVAKQSISGSYSLASALQSVSDVSQPRRQDALEVEEEPCRWMRDSLLFLLIDNVVNGREITTIELFGETLKALLDFDKQINSPALNPSNNASPGQNPLQSNGSHNNSAAVLLNKIKIEKEKFLPVFYDFYLVYLLAPFHEDNDPQRSVANHFYRARDVPFFPSKWSAPHGPRKIVHFVPKDGSGFQTRAEDSEHATDGRNLWFQVEESSRQSSFAIVTSRRLIVEVLTVCVSTHSYRIKYFLLKGNYINKILGKSLAVSLSSDASRGLGQNLNQGLEGKHSNKSLQLYAIKFLKSVLTTKDEFYFRHIEKLDCFRGVIALLQKLQSKDNLLASAIFDLFQFILSENLSVLVSYLMKKYATVFDDLVLLPGVDCFDQLKLRYSQLREHEDHPDLFSANELRDANSNPDQAVAESSSRSRKRLLSRDRLLAARSQKYRRMAEIDREEEYFDDDDDEQRDEEDPQRAAPGEEDREDDDEEIAVVPFESDPDLFPPQQKEKESQRKAMRVLSPHSLHLDLSQHGPDSSSPSSSPLSPHFLETLKYKTAFPSKPPSPPHYSQRKHGSPLDGENSSPTFRPHGTSSSSSLLHQPPLPAPPSDLHPSSAAAKQSGVFSLLSIYDDSDDAENENEKDSDGCPSSGAVAADSDREEGEEGLEETSAREDVVKTSQTQPENSSATLTTAADQSLPPLRSKFETDDDEEVIAAVFSSTANPKTQRGKANSGKAPLTFSLAKSGNNNLPSDSSLPFSSHSSSY